MSPGLDPDVVWATFDTPQSRSLLAGQRVFHVRYTAPRDLSNTARNAREAIRLVRSLRPTHAVSTGSAIAVSFLPVAAAFGARCHYVESAARSDGPSLTGRIVRRVPSVSTYTQYPSWAGRRWQYAGSVFDDFMAARPDAPRVDQLTCSRPRHGTRHGPPRPGRDSAPAGTTPI